jgi:F-type H+-transporting ATPase subunit delta
MADVGARYAQALFELAEEAKMIAVAEDDLRSLKAMRADSLDLRRLIASPAFSAEDKGRAMAAIADKAHFNPLTRKFLGLLAANNRISALAAVITAFEKLAAERRGAVAAEVTTAIKLSAAQQKAISAALKKAFGKDPEITTTIDPTILGGLKVKVGSKLFDASLKSRLDQLKFALKRA